MKSITVLIFLWIASFSLAQKVNVYNLYNDYEKFKVNGFDEKRISHERLIEYITQIGDEFDFQIIGKSLQGKEITLLKYGNGKINVLLWSQMHGDESTATRALMDLLNFLQNKKEYVEFKRLLAAKLSIYIIPMLNPDGADAFNRRNALGIDINRDAERLQFPESKVLKQIRDKLKPDFGFNLHDQMRYYTPGSTFKPATISFLAPAFNYEKEINDTRKRTMQVIASINESLQKIVPGHVGRYSDDFEPRAFGDNMVKWGTSSVLIESGGWYDDENKDFVRKLNFISILMGLQSIATNEYSQKDVEEYFDIPQNDKLLFDLIIRNATIEYKGKDYTIDIAIKNNEKELGNGNYYYESSIEDIGDMSVFYAYTDIDAKGYTIHPGKVYEGSTINVSFDSLIINGYTDIFNDQQANMNPVSVYKLNLTSNKNRVNKIELDEVPNFYLEKNGRIDYVIINGFLYNCITKRCFVKNALNY